MSDLSKMKMPALIALAKERGVDPSIARVGVKKVDLLAAVEATYTDPDSSGSGPENAGNETEKPEPSASPKASSAGAHDIVRMNENAWWCPICDHANTLLTPACGGCGAERDGDQVKPA